MDSRFPNWLRKVVHKLDFLAIPSLAKLLCGLAVVGFVAAKIFPVSIDRFIFDPELVLAGEWWRFFTFPFTTGIGDPLSLLFYVLYVYFVVEALESAWGPGPVTIYVLFSYLMAMIASFVTGTSSDLSWFILENISFAFGTLFPEVELMLYFILPVKAKWLTLFAAGVVLVKFIGASGPGKLFLVLGLVPYLIFFGPLLYQMIKTKYRVRQNRRRFFD